jgi:hypothetical protein
MAKAVSLRIEEPPAKLLDPGEGYGEVSPSEGEKKVMAPLGISQFPKGQQVMWQHLDEIYKEQR